MSKMVGHEFLSDFYSDKPFINFTFNKPLSDEHNKLLSKFFKKHDKYFSGADGTPEMACDWQISSNKKRLEWDSEERYYENDLNDQWLNYLIEKFFKPWGYVLNGKIGWVNDDQESGMTVINNNRVATLTSEEIQKRLEMRLQKLEVENLASKKYIAYLETHLKYMPDGEGALEAKAHFLSCVAGRLKPLEDAP